MTKVYVITKANPMKTEAKDGVYIEIFSVINGYRKSIKVEAVEDFEKRLGVKFSVGHSNEDGLRKRMVELT